jgi:hypothetical protein
VDEKTSGAAEALRLETEFLAGVEANFENAKGRQFRGSIWQTARDDEVESLRVALARNRQTDHREVLKRLPHNRRVTLRGFERTWWFGKRRTGLATASVLAPLEHYAGNAAAAAPPVDVAELQDHVRRIAGDAPVPHVLGVCAPTGFTEQARRLRLDWPNVTLVLTEPDGHGGWRVTAQEGAPDYLLRLFDPEQGSRKLERVRAEIAKQSADLLTGGLSVRTLAGRLDLPEPLVSEAFAQAAAADPELRLSKKSGETLLFRGASAAKPERGVMDVFDKIKQLFSRTGDEARKINALAERRAALAQRRDRLYEDIGRLEQKEAELLNEGKQTASQVARRRLAAQLAQLRKDIGRQNTTAGMLNQQINILSTDIHNLTLIQQGQVAELPTTETLTENAVKAEEMLETLRADAELVSGLETGMNEALTGAEELAILKEFEQADATPPAAARTPGTPAAREPAAETDSDDVSKDRSAARRREKAGPEAG